MKVYMRLHFCFLLVFILTLSSLHTAQAAVGISPGIYNLDFSPNLKKTISFEFLGDNDGELEIYAAGELAEYVTLSKKRIRGNGGIDVTLELPESIDTPGVHTIYIGARPVINGEQGFGIIGNVKGAINIIVPYPGQYALISLSATNANAGQQVNFTTVIDNLGNEAVGGNANLEIYHDNTYITGIDLGDFELASPDQQRIVKYLATDEYAPGNYIAFAELTYGDGRTAIANSSFKLGELNVRLTNYTKILQRNKLNRFEIQVESGWNDPIDGVYANVELLGYPVVFTTPAAHLDSFGSTTLTGFFDTTAIEADNVQALIKINYAGRVTEETVTLTFKKHVDLLVIGLIVAAVIIIALIIFVTYVLRKVQKKRK